MLVARRGLSAGLESEPFTAEDVEEALREYRPDRYVYVEPLNGRLAACGGRAPAAAALAARILPRPGGVALRAAGGALRLRVTTAQPPHGDLTLWPDDRLLARLALPPALHAVNPVSGSAEYACGECGWRCAERGALQLHQLHRCGPHDHVALWRRLLAATAPPGPAATAPPEAAAPPDAAAPPGLTPPALEALAAAWGRVAGGHRCVWCGRLYSRRYGLKIHLRTHTGYRPLRCAHCARRFGDPSNLNKHVRLHLRADAAHARAKRIAPAS